MRRVVKTRQLRGPLSVSTTMAHFYENTIVVCESFLLAEITRTKVIWQKAESLWHVHTTPRLYSPGGSVGLTVWLWLQFEIPRFG